MWLPCACKGTTRDATIISIVDGEQQNLRADVRGVGRTAAGVGLETIVTCFFFCCYLLDVLVDVGSRGEPGGRTVVVVDLKRSSRTVLLLSSSAILVVTAVCFICV